MGYSSLRACVDDLERQGELLRITSEVDPHLEMAEIHREVFRRKGPAIFFEKVNNCTKPITARRDTNIL